MQPPQRPVASEVTTSVAGELFAVLQQKAVRLILKDDPRGAELCAPMQRGGAHPAPTDGRNTSVGTLNIRRWLWSICHRDGEKPRPPFPNKRPRA